MAAPLWPRPGREYEHSLERRLDQNDARFTAASEGLARVLGPAARAAGRAREPRPVRHRPGRPHRRRGASAHRRARAAAARRSRPTRRPRPSRSRPPAGPAPSSRRRAAVLAGAPPRPRGPHRRPRRAARSSCRTASSETERRLAADAEARGRGRAAPVELERSLDALDRLGALVDGHRAVIEADARELVERRRRQSDEVRALSPSLDDAPPRAGRRRAALDEVARAGPARRDRRGRGRAAARGRGRDAAPRPRHRARGRRGRRAARAARGRRPRPARVRELERELRLMGPINPLALEEFTELQERHDVPRGAARRRAHDAPRAVPGDQGRRRGDPDRVRRRLRRRGAQLHAAVRRRCSRAASARSCSPIPTTCSNTGIEVEAKPSGKNVKKLSLLSGGERSR